MPALSYFGTYGRFDAVDRDMGAVLVGADSIVGDEMSFEVVQERAGADVWLSNRFGGRCGKLDAKTAYDVQLCVARGWQVHILLASVYRAQDKDTAHYWGEVAVCAYPPLQSSTLDTFVGNVASKLKEGVRVEVDLQEGALAHLEESGGTWLPSGRRAAAKSGESILIKDRISTNERLVEAARDRHPGCMVVGWAFIAVLVVGVLWALARLLGFL